MTIQNETQFTEAINSFGDLVARVEACKKELKFLKTLLECYAEETKTRSFHTSRFSFRMVRGTAALRRCRDISETDVIALLKANEVTREFIRETYDADQIKAYAKQQCDANEFLEPFGLTLGAPSHTAKVVAI